jgi:glycosyltransferase involved in cell wall biosynthesis
MVKITILIPFYNEAGNIVRQLKDTLSTIKKIEKCDFHIVLVDDGSTDGSSLEVKKFISENDREMFTLIVHEKNSGKTNAFISAFEIIKTDYVIFMDGDYQDDPKEIPLLVEKILSGYEVVIGNQEKNPGLIKKLAAITYRYILNSILKINILTHSPQFYAIKFNFLQGLKLLKNDHRYLVTIALYKKAKFCEIKLKYFSREYGKSKFSKFKIIGAIFDTYKLLSRLKNGMY